MPSVYRGQAGDPQQNPHFLDTFELFRTLGYKAMAVDRQERELSRSELEAYASTGARQGWVTENYLFTQP